jgi:hypothetical protein
MQMAVHLHFFSIVSRGYCDLYKREDREKGRRGQSVRDHFLATRVFTYAIVIPGLNVDVLPRFLFAN